MSRISFLLNWQALPYHAPIYLAKLKGFFAEQSLSVAILQPSDPSDVTELIGTGVADMGLKAMIHTLAAKARGYPIQSIGTLLDEPITGLIYLKNGAEVMATDFASICRGKRIGYVGEFGKIQIDELCHHYGMDPSEYTAVRCGMNVTQALIKGEIDAGIGLENVQMVELEEWLLANGRNRDDVQMLRIDECAELGCCCFCSVLYISNETFLKENPEKVRRFMLACKKATNFIIEQPEEAFKELVHELPLLNTVLYRKMFERSFAYFSATLQNVQRDWLKVTNYGKRLGILDAEFKPNYTNEFLSWKFDENSNNTDPVERQKMIGALQQMCAVRGGFHRVAV